MPTSLGIEAIVFALGTMALAVASAAFLFWRRQAVEQQRLRSEELLQKDRIEQQRLEFQREREEKRREEAERRRYEEREQADNAAASRSAGAGTGGYIAVEMPERYRPMFHDLLKGFEEYARLQGYEIAFSIDASFVDRIAFKFSVRDSGIIVGTERVRQDFRNFLEEVHQGNHDALDDLPVIINEAEHRLLVTILKNRLNFIQHSYKLSETSVRYYEHLLTTTSRFPALPAASVVVQTGGAMDSRSYTAVNSQRLIQGEGNAYSDASINIGESFNERQERVTALEDALARLQSVAEDSAIARGIKGLSNAKDELTEQREPDRSAVQRWLEYAKDGLKTAVLAADVNAAMQKLFALFGMTL
jgi:hypothetical protein